MKAFLALLFSLIASVALAQNTTCATRAPGDNSNACASTSFVQGAVSGIGAVTSLTGPVTGTGPGATATTITPGAVTNSILANMVAGKMKCRLDAAGTGSPQDCNKPLVSVLDFAVGDCTTDDSTAIQNAINSLSAGGMVYFPPAPGGCYAIGSGTAITLPTGKAVSLMGAGRGYCPDTACNYKSATWLKATASIGSVIKSSAATFSRGHRISSMIIDGNNNAAIGLQMDFIGSSYFDNLDVTNNTTANFRLGTATLNSLENVLTAIRFDNPLFSHTPASLPPFNLDNHGTNNIITNIKAVNALTANIHSATTAANNVYNGVHGYNFDYTSAVATAASTNNFLIEGISEQIANWEADGSSSVNMQLNSSGNLVTGGVSQFAAGLTAQIGVRFANATCLNQVVNNIFFNSTAANTIVQAGSACAGDNSVSLNANGTNNSVLGLVSDHLGHVRNGGGGFAIPTITAGCTGAGSSIRADSTDFSGQITGSTAAATTCTITFSNAFPSTVPPRCVVSGQTVAPTTVVPTASTLVINFASTATAVFNWICFGI